MNIYLDIDGVLLVNSNHVAEWADEFLQVIIKKYPDSTYWLTTHCWMGNNRAVEVLAPHLKPETVELLAKVKPTVWDSAKTEGIDFSQPFLWFDDDLYPEEEKVLKAHDSLNNHIMIDLYKYPTQLKELLVNLVVLK